MKIPALLVIAASSFPLAAFTFGAETSPPTNRYQGDLWNELSQPVMMQAAAEITPSAFPNCDTVVVDQKSMRVYHENGTAEMQDDTFTKVLTEKGRRKNGALQLNFQLP